MAAAVMGHTTAILIHQHLAQMDLVAAVAAVVIRETVFLVVGLLLRMVVTGLS